MVERGVGRASGFTALPWVRAGFMATAGIDPYPGTLNVRLAAAADRRRWAAIRAEPADCLPAGDDSSCDADCWPVQVQAAGLPIAAAVVAPRIPGYPPDLLELVSPVALRATLAVGDGSALRVRCARLPPVDAVVFDVDGTLVDSITGYAQAAREAAAEFGFVVDDAMVVAALNDDVPFWPLVLRERASDAQLVARLMAATRQRWPTILREQVRCFDGLAAMLDTLAGRGIVLGICTASRGETLPALAEAGLLDRFRVVVTANDVTHRKPHPEGLEKAAAALGVAPGRVAYVGDTVPDVRAARSAGMTAVGVLTGAGDGPRLAIAGAHRLVAGHAQLAGLLAGPHGAA